MDIAKEFMKGATKATIRLAILESKQQIKDGTRGLIESLEACEFSNAEIAEILKEQRAMINEVFYAEIKDLEEL